ncbi:uncharacterized protein LOC120351591 [Nilaparvata lugens]|uniref:uncharacterized protein LOC120351591 n=1 Tax=Nilaparvata lugens TaxID=108931 RepID=UPI00193CFE83|nr:uncharacterized protein LOC120351591 [Nilaparvata lugens]
MTILITLLGNKAKYKNTIKRLLDDSRDGGQRHSERQVTGRGSIAPRHDFSKEKSQKIYRGRGVLSAIKGAAGTIVNKAIDILPVELHIPGYQYCGPGTKLQKRLAQGDPGINKLDQACKEHDIAYSKSGDTASRAVADSILAERAWDRVRSEDAGVLEKAAALAVTNIMKAKAKFGGGMKRSLKEVSRVAENGKKQKIQPSQKKSVKGGRGGARVIENAHAKCPNMEEAKWESLKISIFNATLIQSSTAMLIQSLPWTSRSSMSTMDTLIWCDRGLHDHAE